MRDYILINVIKQPVFIERTESEMKKTLIWILAAVLVCSLATPCFADNSLSQEAVSKDAIISSQDVKAYCDYYGIEYFDNNAEFHNEVSEMIKERNFKLSDETMSSGGNNGSKERTIPTSLVADIIQTNNPLTPWNHVGLYSKTNEITEALEGGVCCRSTGKQQEYPFEIFKVVKKDSDNRFALVTRKAVSKYATDQMGKDYDFNFYNNKENTAEGNKTFNCSELVWKAWKFNGEANVDIDSNGGSGVYPNNIRKSDRTVKIDEG